MLTQMPSKSRIYVAKVVILQGMPIKKRKMYGDRGSPWRKPQFGAK